MPGEQRARRAPESIRGSGRRGARAPARGTAPSSARWADIGVASAGGRRTVGRSRPTTCGAVTSADSRRAGMRLKAEVLREILVLVRNRRRQAACPAQESAQPLRVAAPAARGVRSRSLLHMPPWRAAAATHAADVEAAPRRRRRGAGESAGERRSGWPCSRLRVASADAMATRPRVGEAGARVGATGVSAARGAKRASRQAPWPTSSSSDAGSTGIGSEGAPSQRQQQLQRDTPPQPGARARRERRHEAAGQPDRQRDERAIERDANSASSEPDRGDVERRRRNPRLRARQTKQTTRPSSRLPPRLQPFDHILELGELGLRHLARSAR